MAAIGMYRERTGITGASSLEQGDVLANLLLPVPATKGAFHDRDNNKALPRSAALPKLGESVEGLRVLLKVTRESAIVLSNSCDIAAGLPLVLAPLRAFVFRDQAIKREMLASKVAAIFEGIDPARCTAVNEAVASVDCSKRSAVSAVLAEALALVEAPADRRHLANEAMGEFEPLPAEKWRQVSEAATGTSTAKTFYLPAHPNSHARSFAALSETDSLAASYIDRCLTEAGTTVTCGLNADAQRHLQWALGLLFGRNPREDEEWPSTEDFILKRAWLEREVGQGGPRHAENKAALDRVLKILDPTPRKPTEAPASEEPACVQ